LTYFVWISGLRGPEAQLWATEPVDGNGKPIEGTLSKQELSKQEERLTLDELAVKFKEKLDDTERSADSS